MGDKILSFEDLVVWQKAQLFAVEIYTLTKSFPSDELYAMTSQLRRVSSSISANIAEGFGRYSTKDKLHFYTMSYGSLLEVKNFLYLAEKLNYIGTDDLNRLIEQSIECQRLILASKKSISK